MTVQRNPDETRSRILDAALEEIHLRGFQGLRVEHILTRTGLTKGALYHHFANKMAIGYAIVDEILKKNILEQWIAPLDETINPVVCIINIYRQEIEKKSICEIEKGCLLNNLVQEMSPIDEGFRVRLEMLYTLWSNAIAAAFVRGQEHNVIRADVDSDKVAVFLLAILQGSVGVMKCQKDARILVQLDACLGEYLHQLQTPEMQRQTLNLLDFEASFSL